MSKICSSCGAENIDEAQFCRKCGKQGFQIQENIDKVNIEEPIVSKVKGVTGQPIICSCGEWALQKGQKKCLRFGKPIETDYSYSERSTNNKQNFKVKAENIVDRDIQNENTKENDNSIDTFTIVGTIIKLIFAAWLVAMFYYGITK